MSSSLRRDRDRCTENETVTSQTVWTGYGTAASAPTTGAQTTTTVYDPTYHTYAIQTVNPLGHTSNVTYDYTLGLPLSETDPNGAVTTATYDAFGRFTSLTRPGDSSPTLTVSYQNSPFVVTLQQRIDDSHTFTVTRHYDGMGRQTLVNTNGILAASTFDVYGNPLTQSTPHTSGETAYYTTTTYDALGRPLTVTAPDGTTTTTAYNGPTSYARISTNPGEDLAESAAIVLVVDYTQRFPLTYDRYNWVVTNMRYPVVSSGGGTGRGLMK